MHGAERILYSNIFLLVICQLIPHLQYSGFIIQNNIQ